MNGALSKAVLKARKTHKRYSLGPVPDGLDLLRWIQDPTPNAIADGPERPRIMSGSK